MCPTFALAKQVQKRLERHFLKADPSLSRDDVRRRMLNLFVKGSFKGSNVSDLVRDAFSDFLVRSKPKSNRIGNNSIGFISHAGFYKLRSEITPEQRLSTEVYFDEAKKSTFARSRLILNEKQNELFESLFKKVQYDKTNFYRLRPKKKVNAKTIEALQASLSPKKYSVFCSIQEDVSNELVEVFVRSKPLNEDSNRIKVHGVTLPAKVFYGYKRVVIMSAYFEHSEMYHLLKNGSSITLTDVTSSIKGYKKELAKIERRFANVVLQPLLKDDKGISTQKLSGTLVKTKKLNTALLNAEASGITPDQFGTLMELLRNGVRPQVHDGVIYHFYKLLYKHMMPHPLRWMVNKTAQLVRAQTDVQGPPLMVLNKDFTDLVPNDWTYVSPSSHGLNSYSSSNVVAYICSVRPKPEMSTFLQARLKGYSTYMGYMVDSCIQAIARSAMRDKTSKSKVYVYLSDTKLAKDIFDLLGGHPVLLESYPESLGDYTFLTKSTIRSMRSSSTKVTKKQKKETKKAVKRAETLKKFGLPQNATDAQLKEAQAKARRKQNSEIQQAKRKDPKVARINTLKTGIRRYEKLETMTDKQKAKLKQLKQELKQLTKS
ncbi:hypothetical protein [Achromobacter phage Motura]|uniref:Uncharacterized protein n=1 Tax=Achromobacter phage Motura TaxID=2591403 RepID=A0A514CTC4_9CAUD|nr:hypothetical protein H1O15_gp113 [Achromobacter phage Motura]QDH83714.1 hypothetical protein [Achromobacter phage Motura]